MGAVSHYLEAEGIPTTGITLIREQTEQMGCPRFLWVPFELGRPFGAPHQPGVQGRVLRSALELFDRDDGPNILIDFPEDAPPAESGASWSCPVSYATTAPSDHSDASDDGLAARVKAEVALLQPWNESVSASTDLLAASGRTVIAIVDLLDRLATDDGSAAAVTDDFAQSLRLACDDIHSWYIDASLGQPGHASSAARNDWFWSDTAVAHLIGAVASTLVDADDFETKMLARRAMVPRPHMERLVKPT